MSGRVHEVKGDHYKIEWLMEAKSNGQKMGKLHTHHINELYVVFSAWCSKCLYIALPLYMHVHIIPCHLPKPLQSFFSVRKVAYDNFLV